MENSAVDAQLSMTKEPSASINLSAENIKSFSASKTRKERKGRSLDLKMLNPEHFRSLLSLLVAIYKDQWRLSLIWLRKVNKFSVQRLQFSKKMEITVQEHLGILSIKFLKTAHFLQFRRKKQTIRWNPHQQKEKTPIVNFAIIDVLQDWWFSTFILWNINKKSASPRQTQKLKSWQRNTKKETPSVVC